jgi:MFS family permease
VSHQVVEQELAGAPPSELHTTWNFVVIVLDCACFLAGMAFMQPDAVLPLLLVKLGASETLVGMMSGLQRAGWLLPQLLSASFVLHRARKKPFLVYPCLISRIPFVVMAVVLMTPWAAGHSPAVLGILFAGYTVFFFGDGLSGVPWHDIIARSIPATLRGRFFGTMQALGAILALGSAAVVARVLASDALDFPRDYGVLLACLSVCMALSTFWLLLIREPRTSIAAEQRPLRELVRAIPSTLRAHPRLRQLVIAQNLCGLAGLATPFYLLYAYERLGLPPSRGGLFVFAGVVGTLVGSFLWAYLCDHKGSTTVIRGLAGVVVLTPLVALAVALAGPMLHLRSAVAYPYALVFTCISIGNAGAWIGLTNYLFEIAPEEVRPLFLGIGFTLSAPNVVMPIIGGALLRHVMLPYEALFALVIGAGTIASLYVRRLPEPRLEAQPAETGNTEAR